MAHLNASAPSQGKPSRTVCYQNIDRFASAGGSELSSSGFGQPDSAQDAKPAIAVVCEAQEAPHAPLSGGIMVRVKLRLSVRASNTSKRTSWRTSSFLRFSGPERPNGSTGSKLQTPNGWGWECGQWVAQGASNRALEMTIES
ncbi:uncharacterized protein N7482_009848 [Penicillium canariense]|uniref:Uncharacterized protein n=1 Tax=Penicillium canariense TaxID=189055 RepID=A0A9W9HRM4_9EURO|nr:uncharacterized protein N7482_009848 [Penicillium canariense]KAJ5153370.1 hypothetical protein N7482_009848 [Penicillium canariense]